MMVKIFPKVIIMPAKDKYGLFTATLTDEILKPQGTSEFEMRYKENGLLIAKELWIAFIASLMILLLHPYLSKILVGGFKFKAFLEVAKSLGYVFSYLVTAVVLFAPLMQGIVMLYPKKVNAKEAWTIAAFAYIAGGFLVYLSDMPWTGADVATNIAVYLALSGIPMILLGPAVTLYMHKDIGGTIAGLALCYEGTITKVANGICQDQAARIPEWRSHINKLTSGFVMNHSKPRPALLVWFSLASLVLAIFFTLEDRTYVYEQILGLNKFIGYPFIEITILAPLLSLALNNTDRALDKIYCRVIVHVMEANIPKNLKVRPSKSGV